MPDAVSQNKYLPLSEGMHEIKDKEGLRKALYELLGKLPERDRPISVEVVSTEEKDGVIIDKNLKEIYAKDGAPEAWKLKIYDVGHEETAEMRKDIFQFLEDWL
jgi:hypothetical protein